jgi:hypothetical protein
MSAKPKLFDFLTRPATAALFVLLLALLINVASIG